MKPSGQLRRTVLHRVTPMPPRTAALPRESPKRRRANRVRAAVIADLGLERGPGCEVPWCAEPWQDGHEPLTRARGGSITDRANTKLVCRTHNEELTREPQWGYDLGFLIHSWEEK